VRAEFVGWLDRDEAMAEGGEVRGVTAGACADIQDIAWRPGKEVQDGRVHLIEDEIAVACEVILRGFAVAFRSSDLGHGLRAPLANASAIVSFTGGWNNGLNHVRMGQAR
jgi:hypothetical protein